MTEAIQSENLPATRVGWGENLKQGAIAVTILGVLIGAGVWYYERSHTQKKADESDAKSFTEGTPEAIAKSIHMALHNDSREGGNMKELRRIISDLKSQEEWNLIATEYDNQYHEELPRRMEEVLESSENLELIAIKSAKPEKAGQKVAGDVLYKAWAERFKYAFDLKHVILFNGVDLEAIQMVMREIPTQRAFINVGVAYNKNKFGDLLPTLKSKLSTSEYYDVMRQLTNKPKA
ncbi:MAG: hypothetical protein ACXVP0_14695 [Bacteroidia bacterium]